MADLPSTSVPSTLQVIHNELRARETLFQKLLPAGMSPSRFALIAYSHIRKSPDLIKCDPMNIVAEVSKAAELGLDFSIPNEVSLVPFKEYKTGTTRCVALPGYKGYAKLARQSEGLKSLNYNVVREGDEFNVELGSSTKVEHKPKFPGSPVVTYFYALGISKTGGIIGPVVMSAEEVEKHAKRYIKAGFGPFGTLKDQGRNAEHFIPYGLKTVLLQWCKRHGDLSARGISVLNNDLKHMEEEKERPQLPDVNAELGLTDAQEPEEVVVTSPTRPAA